MAIDVRSNIHLRSWRSIYEGMFNEKVISVEAPKMPNEREILKGKLLQESLDTYEEELEKIHKWINSNLGYSVRKFTLEDSEEIERFDFGDKYPQLPTYIILQGAVFEESPTGIISLNAKSYSRSSTDSTFYKLVYYEKLRQDMLNKGISG